MEIPIHKRAHESYSVKTLSIEVKDIDQQTRRVKIGLSAFDSMDSDEDVLRMGAFAKSIMERGPDSSGNRKIAFLRHHDWEHGIGTFQKLEETREHLIAIGDLGRSTKGSDALLDYQDGIIREHSIGFNYIADKMEFVEHGDGGFWNIKEVILWEGSAVMFGANSLTPVFDVSKGDHIAEIDKINKRMNDLIGALKNGKGTDDRLHSFEMQLKTLQQRYNDIINSLTPTKPSIKDTKTDEPSQKAEQIAAAQKEEERKKVMLKYL